MSGVKGAPEIATQSAKCTGCLRCQLQCSLTHTGVFNPSKAMIQVQVNDFSEGEEGITVSFSDGCDKCGLCISACPYGALEARETSNRRR
nr:4Fe-4S dicluster domain-containing protein [Candidatus Njordarchaeota archaeon]